MFNHFPCIYFVKFSFPVPSSLFLYFSFSFFPLLLLPSSSLLPFLSLFLLKSLVFFLPLLFLYMQLQFSFDVPSFTCLYSISSSFYLFPLAFLLYVIYFPKFSRLHYLFPFLSRTINLFLPVCVCDEMPHLILLRLLTFRVVGESSST